jgi:hypothetical protein
MSSASKLAGLQYAGIAGVSESCLNAVRRFIQFGDRVREAIILTAGSEHAFLLDLAIEEQIAIRAGFSSGYDGTGPHAFADALELLEAHGAEIRECEVEESLIRRIDDAALTVVDLEAILGSPEIRPTRWYGYIYAVHNDRRDRAVVWGQFPAVMPWQVIDPRITDLAKAFFENADNAILTGFRRLEDLVRTRTGSDEHGGKLFSQAFLGESSKLHWPKIASSEQTGRGQIFTGTFSAFRNPRAHQEVHGGDSLAEFLALNLMYRLESSAVDRPLQTNGSKT